MFLRATRLECRLLKPHFNALPLLSPFTSVTRPLPPNDTVLMVSAFLKQPDWQKSEQLKSLVSHLSPHMVPKIVALHRGNIPLCLEFFKWVCGQSTYCYDIDSRVQLLYLLASDNLHGLVDKVMVWLIKECCRSQDDVLKLICGIDHLRDMYGFWINYPSYSMLMMRLARLDLGLKGFLVFNRMVEDGFVARGIDYRNVINALSKNGHAKAVEMFFSRALKLGFDLDVYIYASLVLVYCRTGHLSEAFRVFALMCRDDGCGVNSATYSILVHGLCKLGRLDEACKLKDAISEKGCQPSTSTYTILIKAMCDEGLVDQAFNLLDEMQRKGHKPNVYTYTVLVDMFCRKGKIEEANGMFRKMLKDGMSPTTETFNALINGYCKEGRMVSALELLAVMERKHCKPNIRTYNELMEGLCRSGSHYKAMVLLGKVINNGLHPTEVTFNILINGFCRAGQINTGLELLHLMNSIGVEPDQFSYTALIDSFCKIERLDQAGVALGLMIKKGLSIDEVTKTALIDGYCKTGKIRYAHFLFEKMIEDQCLTSPHTFNVFLDVLGSEVNAGAKNAMLAKLLKYGLVPSVVTYTILVDAICRVGDTNNSYIMLDLMRRDGCPPNIYTYTVVISGLCRSGKVEHAENLLLEMRKDGVLPNNIIYALLVKSHIAASKMNRALDIVSAMLQNGCLPNTQIYLALLEGFMMTEANNSRKTTTCTGGLNRTGVDCSPNFIFEEMEMNHAFLLIDKVKEWGVCPVDVYKFLIMGLCSAGRILGTDILLQEMLKCGLIPDSDICDCIIRHFSVNGDFNRCIEWITKLSAYGCVPSLASYCAVFVGLRNGGRQQEAERLISDLLRNSNVEDRTVISPYIGFLVKGEVPCRSFELLNLIQQINFNKKLNRQSS